MKSRKRSQSIYGTKAFVLFPGTCLTFPGLLHSIALHLRDSPPDILRRPSKEQCSNLLSASAMFPFVSRACCARV